MWPGLGLGGPAQKVVQNSKSLVMFDGEEGTCLGPRKQKGMDRNLISVLQCQFPHHINLKSYKM